MISDIAPHPCGGGAKVFPRNCRLRVFFLFEKRSMAAPDLSRHSLWRRRMVGHVRQVGLVRRDSRCAVHQLTIKTPCGLG